ncbi:sulfatase [Lentisphaerota bacterium WC36G]|nr:sulfatase [Lentisphaerae bacterium WC36]
MRKKLLFLTGMLALNINGQTSNPNFVFILVDDMGWTGSSVQMDDKIKNSISDYYQTPNLEKLASNGVRFSNAYSPAALCSPSRASILTGKSPAQLHITTPGRPKKNSGSRKLIAPQHISEFPESEITIPELLKSKGYVCAHFGKWHLNGGGPEQHGFEISDGNTSNAPNSNFEENNPKDIFGITQRAEEFMAKNVKANKPFYVQLSHYAVHEPIACRNETLHAVEKWQKGNCHNNEKFAAMTKDFDTSVGMVLDKIKELGIADNTYIIFMSDNGAGKKATGRKTNFPLRGGKGSFYEGGIRVPMIICGPEISKNRICREKVIGYDLLPTICQLAKITKLPENIEGVSLKPLILSNGNIKRSKPLLFHFPHYGKGPRQKPQSAIIDGNYKLIYNPEDKSVELYDLSLDISESKNLAKSDSELTSKLKKLLQQRLKEVGAQFTKENSTYN